MAENDYIQECMESMPQQGSLDDFKRAFCDVCINPECKRSRFKDSKWVTRMIMQEEALFNPRFANENDPRYDHLRAVNFEPVDEQTLKYYGGWVDLREDGTVVHQGETPVEEKDSSKIDQAVASLKGGLTKTTEEPDSPPAPEPAEEAEPEPTKVEAPAPPEPTPKPVQRSQRPKNTEVPQGGIILGPAKPDIIQRPSRLLQPPSDPWAVDGAGSSKRGKNGKLTVRVSDGKVVKED
jgi:hypothetical protein